MNEDAAFRAAVREGFAAIDRGEFLEEEEMDERIARISSVEETPLVHSYG